MPLRLAAVLSCLLPACLPALQREPKPHSSIPNRTPSPIALVLILVVLNPI